MRRVIKFRTWCHREKHFVGPEEYLGEYDILTFANPFARYLESIRESWNHQTAEAYQRRHEEHCSHYTPQQFTGLLDKNGKEIYEGDILSMTGSYSESMGERGPYIGAVAWNVDAWEWERDRLSENAAYAEIIGNIFENPELLQVALAQTTPTEPSDEDETFASCEQCGESAWGGYICHSCGFKKI